MCQLFYMCSLEAVQAFFFGLAVVVVFLAFFVVMGFVAYFEAKSKMPPVTGDDITKIIDDAKRRAYERGRYE